MRVVWIELQHCPTEYCYTNRAQVASHGPFFNMSSASVQCTSSTWENILEIHLQITAALQLEGLAAFVSDLPRSKLLRCTFDHIIDSSFNLKGSFHYHIINYLWLRKKGNSQMTLTLNILFVRNGHKWIGNKKWQNH